MYQWECTTLPEGITAIYQLVRPPLKPSLVTHLPVPCPALKYIMMLGHIIIATLLSPN